MLLFYPNKRLIKKKIEAETGLNALASLVFVGLTWHVLKKIVLFSAGMVHVFMCLWEFGRMWWRVWDWFTLGWWFNQVAVHDLL